MKMHLMDGDLIPVSPDIAALLGINHAAILQQLHFLLTITQKTKRNYNHVDGEWWVYNSYEEWKTEHFKWMGRNAIIRVFNDLEARGLVISRKGVKNSFDRKKWYRIDYTAWEALKLSIVPNPNDQIVPLLNDEIVPNQDDVYTESIENTENTPITSGDVVTGEPPKKERKPRKKAEPKEPKPKPPDVVFDTIAECAYGIKDTSNVSNGSTIGSLKKVAVEQFTLEYGQAEPDVIAKTVRMFAATRRGFPQYQSTFEAPYIAYLQTHRPAIQALISGIPPSNGNGHGKNTAGLDDVTGGGS